ncbi:MAG TPA: alpha-L-fucosidase [Anaerohalosphaeraceae bacterium]|nr:alpha-L-fucosidase [Anaerohalosphaeraceae bacterium]HOM76948.1 alpha-L-fucosidase [Anaerohalosphaeraceae bacterium]HPC64393.1 alpha-L-fucosidase [Anaerohalosphaeraceae bacterium]HPO70193.1 alpha-L-fucosidase [Anaerohalosphaeraceae bacterium]HRS71014.1 alpha-L-fucosidase [Anaerohalosphaeraceae bacterium]
MIRNVMKYTILLAVIFLLQEYEVAQGSQQKSVPTKKQTFQPNFESLEKANPVPEWFRDAKFGIYFHWGVYSVPAFANEWYPRSMYIKGSAENKHHLANYGEVSEWPYHNFIIGAKDKQGRFVQFAPKLKSEGGQFDPDEWAQLFADAGAKFAGPVAEHHDGFSMWASRVNPWNAKDMGPKLDLVGLLTDAIRKKNMKVILSMHHAYNITGFYDVVPKTNDPLLQMLYGQQGKEKNEALWLSKHQEIIQMYQPDIIWQDFNLHIISQPVLLEFLAYYYNKAGEWNKEVVATYKDGLNIKCAVLDYERGGPADITENYWLTDDAVSSSSWCYTEGIRYYSTKQVLHGFLDRISKNGNLLLNISPKADGSIPEEQKDMLLAIGAWLKKYGEAVYATRAWEQYGEGPTKMGGAHGQMGPPSEGTAGDIRYTRSKDNKTLYAMLLGWEQGQTEVVLKSLSTDRIVGQQPKSVRLINGRAGEYLPLVFKQDAHGLTVCLPERPFEELAYVLRIDFDNSIPPLSRHADLDCTPYYHIVPANSTGRWVLGSDFSVTEKTKQAAHQWKLESAGKGVYIISNRQDPRKVIDYNISSHDLILSEYAGKNSQFWKIDDARNGLFTISNKYNPNAKLSLSETAAEGTKAGLDGPLAQWNLVEVCDLKQTAFKPHVIPGTIQAEDFDTGCPGDAFYDSDDKNEGGQYRLNQGVDIETCSAGGYNVGWTRAGEWLAYTIAVSKTGAYRVSFYVASAQDSPRMHLECGGSDITGIISVPNTGGFQNWQIVTRTVNLEAGERILKLVIDGNYVNLDKMVFEEIE